MTSRYAERRSQFSGSSSTDRMFIAAASQQAISSCVREQPGLPVPEASSSLDFLDVNMFITEIALI